MLKFILLNKDNVIKSLPVCIGTILSHVCPKYVHIYFLICVVVFLTLQYNYKKLSGTL